MAARDHDNPPTKRRQRKRQQDSTKRDIIQIVKLALEFLIELFR